MEEAISIAYTNGMELRHIRYFLAVAEEGNFTRAAARLGIGQPPLSLQIRDLEREVGAQLFHRVPHGAELTEAGRVFFERVAPLPERARQAAEAARRAERGETGTLRLGFTGTSVLHPVLGAAIRAFRRRFSEVELVLEEANSATLLDGLEEERLDAAILRPSLSEAGAIQAFALVREHLVAAVPSGHAAASGAAPLDLERLAGEPLLLTPRRVGTSLHDAAIEACRQVGFEPVLGQSAPQIASVLSLVSAELGFSLVPDALRQLSIAGVAYRDLVGPAPHVELAVAYRRQRPARLAVNFADMARAAARDLAAGSTPNA